MKVEMFVFLVSGAICLGGALGVVLFRNPVHNALSLIATLFGVAVLFIAQGAYFLAAIQVIVYAGAIAVLFVFVLMLLGVDKAERIEVEPLAGQRPAAVAVGVGLLGLGLTALLSASARATGTPSSLAAIDPEVENVTQLGRVLFTDYIFVFEITGVLLTIAVVGAVVLSRKGRAPIDLEEFGPTAADELRERVAARAAATAGAAGDDAYEDDDAEDLGDPDPEGSTGSEEDAD